MFAPKSFYPEGKPYELAIFDLRVAGATERCWSERTAWQERADIEVVDEHHYALIVRPGLSGENAA